MAAPGWTLIGAVLGLVVGSFIALVTLRWPQDLPITGRSRCDHCGTTLAWPELIPLLSILMQRGRCRHCGQVIAARHWQIELAGAAVGAALLGKFAHIDGLWFAVVGWWLLTLLILDVEHHWLPDLLTLPFLLLALLLPGLPLATRLWGAALGFAGLWLVGFAYRRWRGRDGLGGGDPKLLAGLGALFGPLVLPFLVTAAAALGLALAGWDALRGRGVNATTRLPLGALLVGVAFVLLLYGPDWIAVAMEEIGP